jgi:hypothetical protein
MKRTALAAALAAALPLGAAAADREALRAEGQALIKAFASTLKGELQAAMKAGGPTNAIAVCNVRAPEIAEEVSEASGWTVARSSHRLRNPANAPDAWTEAAIEDFLAREAEGESAKSLAKAGIVEEDGRTVFRMARAIPTAKVCLACHGGETVKPAVEAKLAELYPDDRARGFSVGEMRGVFTLSTPLD